MSLINQHHSWFLRKASEADEVFLRTLYASTRANEKPLVSWSAFHRTRFLGMQYEAQYKSYATQYPHAERLIIVIGGRAAGRLILNRSTDDIRIVDISLLPEHRSKGIGTSILSLLIEQAQDSHASLSLSVLSDSPALRLYQRLGFKEYPGGAPPYLQLKREGS